MCNVVSVSSHLEEVLLSLRKPLERLSNKALLQRMAKVGAQMVKLEVQKESVCNELIKRLVKDGVGLEAWVKRALKRD